MEGKVANLYNARLERPLSKKPPEYQASWRLPGSFPEALGHVFQKLSVQVLRGPAPEGQKNMVRQRVERKNRLANKMVLEGDKKGFDGEQHVPRVKNR